MTSVDQNRRRITMGALDQAIASFASLILLVAVSSSATPEYTGVFAFAYATGLFAVSISRALAGDDLLRLTARNGAAQLQDLYWRSVWRLSLIAGVMWLPASYPFLDSWQEVAFGSIAVSGAVLFDGRRYVLVSAKDSIRLLGADVSFLVLALLSVLVVSRISDSPSWSLLVLGVSYFTSATLRSGRPGKLALATDVPNTWRRLEGRGGYAYASEALLGAALGYAIVAAVALYGGLAEVAGYRTAISLFGLTSVWINYVRTHGLSHLASQPDLGPFLRSMPRVHAGVVLVVLGILVLLVALPEWIGTMLFGETWQQAEMFFVAAAVARIAALVSVLPVLAARRIGVTWAGVFPRLVVCTAGILAVPNVVRLYGGNGAFVLEASLNVVLCVLLWIVVLRRTSMEQAS